MRKGNKNDHAILEIFSGYHIMQECKDAINVGKQGKPLMIHASALYDATRPRKLFALHKESEEVSEGGGVNVPFTVNP